MENKNIRFGFTFDDLILVPARSEVLPNQVDVRTMLSRNIDLNIPIVSAAMDTVTESALAIALAQEGGLGIIHYNMTVDQQVREVDKVKRSESGVINDPVTLSSHEPVETAREGLKILAMLGAPEAPPLFLRALRSPVRAIRWTGVQQVSWIGEGAKQTLPALGALLDDPGLRGEVIEQLFFILDLGVPRPRDWPTSPLTDEEQEKLAQRYKERLRELGHLR